MAKTKIAIPLEQLKQEKELLQLGLSYSEIERLLGVKRNGLVGRNFSMYKVDMVGAFRIRLEKENTPNRLCVSNDFGYWFSGLFDGEGCLFAAYTKTEHILGIQICLRADDLQILKDIKEKLGCGNLQTTTDKPNSQGYQSNPKSILSIRTSKDVYEILVPLFDKYPLRSKKRFQYPLWKKMAKEKYIYSMGGKSHLQWAEKAHKIWIKQVEQIRKLKKYTEQS